MSFWSAVVLIVVIGCITEMYRERQKSLRAGRKDSGPLQPLAVDPQAERELAELRERVKVLERIATEANSADGRRTRAMAEEIEALRND